MQSTFKCAPLQDIRSNSITLHFQVLMNLIIIIFTFHSIYYFIIFFPFQILLEQIFLYSLYHSNGFIFYQWFKHYQFYLICSDSSNYSYYYVHCKMANRRDKAEYAKLSTVLTKLTHRRDNNINKNTLKNPLFYFLPQL